MSLQEDILSQVGEALLSTAEPEQRLPVTCVIEHSLLPEHIADYADQHGNLATAQKSDEKDLSKLRARHHGIARMLAEGVPEGVVAEMNGITGPYLSTLKNTPSMIELINFYRQPKTDVAKLMGHKLRILADRSADEIMKRLEGDKAGEVSISELAAVAKLGFDRSGNGPNSTVTQVEEHRLVASEELLELAREARRRDAARIVDAESVRHILPKGEASEPSGPEGKPQLPNPDTDRDSSDAGGNV